MKGPSPQQQFIYLAMNGDIDRMKEMLKDKNRLKRNREGNYIPVFDINGVNEVRTSLLP